MVSATDAAGSVGKAAFTWLIAHDNAQLLQWGATEPVDPVGTDVSIRWYAYDSNLSVTAPYAVTGLPPGLSMNPATGLITGTPVTAGVYFPVFHLSLPTSGPGSVPVIGLLTVPWTITPLDGTAVSLPTPGNQNDSVAGTPVSLALHAADTDPTADISYAASGLPPGLSIDRSSGVISGTPGTPGTYRVTVLAYDTSALPATGTAGVTSVTFLWTVTGMKPGGSVLLPPSVSA